MEYRDLIFYDWSIHVTKEIFRVMFMANGSLGARDFSSAVSGFCTAEDVSAFGQHRKFPPHARKTSGTQGREMANVNLYHITKHSLYFGCFPINLTLKSSIKCQPSPHPPPPSFKTGIQTCLSL